MVIKIDLESISSCGQSANKSVDNRKVTLAGNLSGEKEFQWISPLKLFYHTLLLNAKMRAVRCTINFSYKTKNKSN